MGDYVVEVRFYSYRNPSGRCDGCGNEDIPACCDEDDTRPIGEECRGICDTTMIYCIREFGDMTMQCPEGEGLLALYIVSNRNSLNFATAFEGGTFFGFPNPLLEMKIGAWMVSL
jgi:hypothetical protein